MEAENGVQDKVMLLLIISSLQCATGEDSNDSNCFKLLFISIRTILCTLTCNKVVQRMAYGPEEVRIINAIVKRKERKFYILLFANISCSLCIKLNCKFIYLSSLACGHF
jgi:hypothetical protein